MTDLPKPCAKPCSDCPWRKVSAPGWLGPYDAATWIRLAQSDEPIACHTTIDADENGEGDWSNPRMRQCAGAARYRRSMGKRVRDPQDASNFVEADRDNIFSSPVAFMEHHGGSMADLLAPFTPSAPVVVDHLDKPRDTREDPCDGCPDEEAEWECGICRRHYGDGCIDAFGSECPECMTDPGWMPLDDADEEW